MVELKLLDKKDESLLNRTLYWLEADIGNSPTPSRMDLRTFAAKFLKLDDDNLIIESVKSHFGESKIVFSVRAYTSQDAIKKIELPWRIKRNSGPEKQEEQKKEEAKAEPGEKKESKPEEGKQGEQGKQEEKKPEKKEDKQDKKEDSKKEDQPEKKQEKKEESKSDAKPEKEQGKDKKDQDKKEDNKKENKPDKEEAKSENKSDKKEEKSKK
jgi:ribosomal protein S24E